MKNRKFIFPYRETNVIFEPIYIFGVGNELKLLKEPNDIFTKAKEMGLRIVKFEDNILNFSKVEAKSERSDEEYFNWIKDLQEYGFKIKKAEFYD